MRKYLALITNQQDQDIELLRCQTDFLSTHLN